MNDIRIDTNLKLPTWYADVEDYKAIVEAEKAVMDGLSDDTRSVHGNLFFMHMDSDAIAEWEAIFGIYADPTTESLDFRRQRLLNRASYKPPFTVRYLERKLNELIGAGKFTITVDAPNFTFYVESEAKNQNYAQEIAFTINSIKPAHIIYVNKPYVNASAVVNETISEESVRYNYRLGSWNLGVLPFASIQSEVIIKMATQSSIQPALIHDMASSIATSVAKARLNGSVLITDLTKTTINGNTIIEYAVDPDDVSVITSVELLDSDNTVLTASGVYVPVTENVQIKHSFMTEEGINE